MTELATPPPASPTGETRLASRLWAFLTFPWHRTLAGRCFVALLVVLAISMITTVIMVQGRVHKAFEDRFLTEVDGKVGYLVQRFEALDPGVSAAEIQDLADRYVAFGRLDLRGVRVIDEDGDLVAQAVAPGFEDTYGAIPSGRPDAPEIEQQGKVFAATTSIPGGNGLAILQTLWDPAPTLDIARTLLNWGRLRTGLTTLLILLAIPLVLHRLVTRPIAQVEYAMREVAGDRIDVGLPDTSIIELQRMNRTLTVFRENMLERLKLARRGAAAEARAAELQQDQLAESERRRVEREAARLAELEEAKALGDQERALIAKLTEVIERAGAGDYTVRMETDPDASEATMRISRLVNDLVEDMERGLLGVADTLGCLADGKISARMEGEYMGAFAVLQTSVNAAAERLDNALSEISERATDILGDSSDLSAAASELSIRTERTASAVAETTGALEAMVSSIAETARLAGTARENATRTEAEVLESDTVVADAIDAMEQIRVLSERITRTLAIIDDIAFQTNLLALNAGVEAARAGSAGRGFAVVASEVRALAGKVSEAAQQIGDLVHTSSERIEEGVGRVGRTGETLSSLGRRVREIGAQVEEIADAASTQSENADEMNEMMGEIDRATQQNAAMFEETTAANLSLKGAASRMLGVVADFGTSTDTDDRHWADAEGRADSASADAARRARKARDQGAMRNMQDHADRDAGRRPERGDRAETASVPDGDAAAPGGRKPVADPGHTSNGTRTGSSVNWTGASDEAARSTAFGPPRRSDARDRTDMDGDREAGAA